MRNSIRFAKESSVLSVNQDECAITDTVGNLITEVANDFITLLLLSGLVLIRNATVHAREARILTVLIKFSNFTSFVSAIIE
jgi:hypothetical protein